MPRSRSSASALAMSPSASARARRQSMMPASVFSRSALTFSALIFLSAIDDLSPPLLVPGPLVLVLVLAPPAARDAVLFVFVLVDVVEEVLGQRRLVVLLSHLLLLFLVGVL